MTPFTLSFLIAVLLFLVLMQAGRDRQVQIRCVMCGTRYGEKHHADCPWKHKS